MRRTVIWIERFHASTSLTDSKASSISSDGCIYSYAWEISQWMQMRSEMQLPEAAINSRLASKGDQFFRQLIHPKSGNTSPLIRVFVASKYPTRLKTDHSRLAGTAAKVRSVIISST
jgi:hypothetical protein